MPAKIVERAPELPNVYTDGSLNHPTLPTYALATAGIWHPGRQSEALPLTTLEKELALHKFTNDGLESYYYLTGLPSSSTRTELLGLLGSLYIPQGVHVALDNQAVVNK
eukprot:9014037-Karenia_brevis.AAC.1